MSQFYLTAMLRRLNIFSICVIFGLSVLLIIAGSRYTDNTVYRPLSEERRNVRNYLKVDDFDDILLREDGTIPVETILEKTRAKIRSDFINYNFSRTKGEDSLESFLFDEGGQPLRSLVLSTWRSGTTFLGEVINALPGNYYHYEPLLRYGIVQIRGSPDDDSALNSIRQMLDCKHEGMDEYFNYGKEHLHQFSHNTRLWEYCKMDRKLCFDADFTSKFCRLFPFQSMKIVRLRLYLIENFLKEKDFRVKVVFLVRDPRGVMQSRQHRDFCQPSPDCWKPELLCADMVSDYVAAAHYNKNYPDKFMVIRYEDLAMNPNGTTHDLLKFLGVGSSQAVDEFLQSHTTVQMGGVSSTFRVSQNVPFRWKTTLDFDYVYKIQTPNFLYKKKYVDYLDKALNLKDKKPNVRPKLGKTHQEDFCLQPWPCIPRNFQFPINETECIEAMGHWGYSVAHNASHMQSDEFIPIEEYSFY